MQWHRHEKALQWLATMARFAQPIKTILRLEGCGIRLLSCQGVALKRKQQIFRPHGGIFYSAFTAINKSLSKFAHWANKEQIAKRKEQLKHLSYRRRPVSIVFCGLCHLCYETIDPDLVSPTKIFNFCGARSRGNGFLFTLINFYLSVHSCKYCLK